MASLKIKELFCLFYSALLFISGVLLIGFSVVLSIKIFYHFKFIPSNSIGPFIVLFLLGFIHLFLTWLGIKGPTREHDVHIILFMIITTVLIIAECAVGAWSVVIWNSIDVESVLLMKKSFTGLIQNEFDKKEWARLETKLECCGLNGILDYRDTKNIIPISCCDMAAQNATCVYHTDGCVQPLASYVRGVLIDGVIMAFTSCLFQALGVAAFCSFYRALKQERAARAQRRLEMQRRVSHESSPSAHPASASPVAPPASA